MQAQEVEILAPTLGIKQAAYLARQYGLWLLPILLHQQPIRIRRHPIQLVHYIIM